MQKARSDEGAEVFFSIQHADQLTRYTLGIDSAFVDATCDSAQRSMNEATPCVGMVDWGAGRQIAVELLDREGPAIRSAYRRCWPGPRGKPRRVVSDWETGGHHGNSRRPSRRRGREAGPPRRRT